MKLSLITLVILFSALNADGDRRRTVSRPEPSSGPEMVRILGWDGDAMEPFISPDGQILLFNDSNDPELDTDLHWAKRSGERLWVYQGPILGVNSEELDAVPSLDENGRLYFISTRSYAFTLSTIHRGFFDEGVVSGVELLASLSRRQPGWVNFDAEITRTGGTLYFVDGQFSPLGFPLTADLVVALNLGDRFTRLVNSSEIMSRINTSALEYAPAVSPDELTLFFTRAENTMSIPRIWRATRSTTTEAWGAPEPLTGSEDFVEAPALGEDGKYLYYHRRVGERFVIERISILQ